MANPPTDPPFYITKKCTLCLKPNLKHRQIPHATFTILTTCPHGTGDDAPHNLSPNKAVAAILPYEDRQYACLGNLVVVKHPLADPAASNEDLPIVDLVRADFPFVDEMVRRWAYHLSALTQKPKSS
ncbi:hypothetical protein B0H13DRAFT_2371332 [Mycena leptocephala]|nr:hypothetical protein B0H13DRAFT_2371332 [Mycena leptocephala]